MNCTKTQRIIEPDDYTSRIRQIMATLFHRMNLTLTEYSRTDDIIVIQDGNITYVLANPVLGREPLYNEFGKFEKWIPTRNITAIWSDDWKMHTPDQEKFTIRQPRTRVIRPDLCMKILPDGTVIDGGIVPNELISTPHSDRLMFDALLEMVGMD